MDAPVTQATDFGGATNIILAAILVLCAVVVVAWLVSLVRRPYDDDPDN